MDKIVEIQSLISELNTILIRSLQVKHVLDFPILKSRVKKNYGNQIWQSYKFNY